MQTQPRALLAAFAATISLIATAADADADTVWTRCDACTNWQQVNAATTALPQVALGQPVNTRVAVVDFENGNHRFFLVTGYYDVEFDSYMTQTFNRYPTASETNEVASLLALYAQLEPLLAEASGGEVGPGHTMDIPLPSAFDYWSNPGRMTVLINDMIFQRLDSWHPDVLDRAKMRLVFREDDTMRLRAEDGTILTVTAQLFIGSSILGLKDVEFEVTRLQTEDGTVIPLIRSDLDENWAAIVVSGGNNLRTILDTLSDLGIILVPGSGGDDIEIDVPEATIECFVNGDGLMECIVTPRPKDPE